MKFVGDIAAMFQLCVDLVFQKLSVRSGSSMISLRFFDQVLVDE